jgi:hypothetical protein
LAALARDRLAILKGVLRDLQQRGQIACGEAGLVRLDAFRLLVAKKSEIRSIDDRPAMALAFR